jgi:hypothetical protein
MTTDDLCFLDLVEGRTPHSIDLLGSIQHLEHAGVDLYLDQQAIDHHTHG